MTLKSPLCVRVERPGKAFAGVMNEIRTWLDSQKIQPIDFRSDGAARDGVAFELKFNQEDEARLFEQAFT